MILMIYLFIIAFFEIFLVLFGLFLIYKLSNVVAYKYRDNRAKKDKKRYQELVNKK